MEIEKPPAAQHNQIQKYWSLVWADKTRERARQKGFSARTCENYKHAVKAFTKYLTIHPEFAQKSDIKAYLNSLEIENKYSPATVNLHIDALRFFYKEIIGRSYNGEVFKKLKLQRSMPDILTKPELRQIFCCVHNIKHRLLLKAGYAFGLEAKCAVALKLSDFDFPGNVLIIKGGHGKNNRRISISSDFLHELKNYLQSARSGPT